MHALPHRAGAANGTYPPARSRSARIACSLLACMSPACATATRNVEGDDGSVLALQGRVRVPFSTVASSDVPSAAGLTRPSSEIWIEVLDASGEDAQELEAGERISFDDAQFVGPARVSSTLDVEGLGAACAFTGEMNDDVRVAAIVGLVLIRREIELRTSTASVRDTASLLGPTYGLELELGARRSPVFAFAGFRGALAFGSGSGVDTRAIEAGVGWRIDEHFAVRAGLRYAKWLESPSGSASDVDYVLSGPAITLDYAW